MSPLVCMPFAVGHGQEGLCLELGIGPYRIMLDCGLTNLQALKTASDGRNTLDLLFCSHAHPDHTAGMLEFHRLFPEVPIYGSEATTQLLALSWPDQPEAVDLCQAIPWHTPLQLAEDLTMQIWPAGHLPGAACALFTYRSPERLYRVFYTGDFFMSNSRLVDGLPLEVLRGLRPDVLIVEGTAGTACHPHRRQQENQLATTIGELRQQGRSLLLPVPTLGLGQELVMLLRSHHHFTGEDLTVWVEDRVAAGCDAYLELLAHLPGSVQNFARHQPLFWDERILPRIRRLIGAEQLDDSHPCIVIADQAADPSAYCRTLTQPWSVLLPEAWAADLALAVLSNPGLDCDLPLEWLQSLAPDLELGRVQLETYDLATHSDRLGTTQLIHNLRPQHVVLIHGHPTHLADLAALEELQTRYHLHLPTAGKFLEFPLGDRFLQPPAPEPVFAVAITEGDDYLQLQLPAAMTADRRWRRLTDSGLVQVRWQGDDLVLKGIRQEDRLRSRAMDPSREFSQTCHHCRHLSQGHCHSPSSPLYGKQVSPEGSCQAFEQLLEPGDQQAL
ncbi:MAG: MBL fold metallo-hydrolase [Cyanobacteria bacterium REEB459]|nr:MBL fold metallo-hydrolase [Cyanobacteria bacterium REEB459]